MGVGGEGACVGAAMNAGGRFCGDPGGADGAWVGAGGEGAGVGAGGRVQGSLCGRWWARPGEPVWGLRALPCAGSNMGVAASYASAAANEQSASNRIDCMRWSQPHACDSAARWREYYDASGHRWAFL